MGTHTEKHPNEELGLDVDSPRPFLSSDALGASETNFRPMRCYNLITGQAEGWLGTYGNNVDLVHDIKDAAMVDWYSYQSDLYLRKDTNPAYRYLGVGYNSYATWGVTGGWNDAVVYNSDHTISLKSDPKRKLYKYGNDWVCWSKGEDNQNILRFEFE